MKLKKLAFIAVLALSASAFAIEATVVSVSGKVEMQEGRNWVVLRVGNKIEKSAVISTGYNSNAVIEFKGTKFTLGALTRMTVEDLLEENDKDTTNLFIESGSVSANVNGSDGKRVGFKVRSPIATASVRGTVFTVTASGKLSVERGNVAYAPSNSKGEKGVSVSAGQQSTADANGTCSAPAQEKSQAAAGGSELTTTLAAAEAVTTAPSTAVGATTSVFDLSSTAGAVLNITLNFGN